MHSFYKKYVRSPPHGHIFYFGLKYPHGVRKERLIANNTYTLSGSNKKSKIFIIQKPLSL